MAAVRAESSFIDLEESLAISIDLIEKTAGGCAELNAFPETFLPCYPELLGVAAGGTAHPLL
ncbi:hypothetical protein ACFUC1_05535 [Pedococcus sp. NPDC057267]|uniref:hypothetical protein n=1 Tax=Pedococcus sp. NPDC057267 TaxID=3346077 RepID=UPI0036291E8B